MGSQKPPKEKPAEVQAEVKAAAAPAAEVAKDPAKAQAQVKKWKGKTWYSVLAPEMFSEKELGEIPATDPKALFGRNVEVHLSELTGNQSRYIVKIRFQIKDVKGDKATTEFNGISLAREQVFRIVRKRTTKVEVIVDAKTKDNWLLHFKVFAVLNRACNGEIERKVRLDIMAFLKEYITSSVVKDVVKSACDGVVQKNIKKHGSKVYPIRFCEVVKIDVMKNAGKKVPVAVASEAATETQDIIPVEA